MNMMRLANFRRSGRVLVAIGLLAAVGRAAVADEGGIWLGPVNLSPTLNIGIFYESNPDEVNENRKELMEAADENRFDSTEGFNIQPGLNLLLPGNQWKLSGRLVYTYEDDNSDYSRSPEDWRETLKFDGETDGGTSWALGQSAQQLSYQQYDEFSQDDRFGFGVNGMLGRQITDKSGLSVGASYRLVDYEDDYLYDSDNQVYSLTFKHQLTEKTDGLLSLPTASTERITTRWAATAILEPGHAGDSRLMSRTPPTSPEVSVSARARRSGSPSAPWSV